MTRIIQSHTLRSAAAALLSLFASASAIAEPVETVCRGAFQSFYEDYEFHPQGGEFFSYPVTFSIDGEKAVVSNLFNLEAGYPEDYSREYTLDGVYDESTRTLTIPTPREFDRATLAGEIYGYLPGVLLAGTAAPDGALTTDPALVFNVSEDGSRLSTSQAFGVMMFSSEGSAVGWKCYYKGGVILDISRGSELVCFTDTLDLGRCYRDAVMPGSLRVFNLSKKSATLSVSTDNPLFSPMKETVKVGPLAEGSVGVEYCPVAEGRDEALLSVESASGRYEFRLLGECMTPIDYSSIIDEGEMSVTTGAMYPFRLCEFEGHSAARSSCVAVEGCESVMTVGFDVAEGELGFFSWKGVSSSAVSYAGVPKILTDGELYGSYEGILNADISGSQVFAPGHHEVVFSYSVDWVSYFEETDCMTVYGLSLTSRPIQPREALLLTPQLVMPNSLIDNQPVDQNGVVVLKNLGTEPLSLTGADDALHFKVDAVSGEVQMLSELSVPVRFEADRAGTFAETVTLHTSAGDFEVPCSALVRDMPDFSVIVSEGDFTFHTDAQNPWLVADGKAFNSTSKVADEQPTHCRLTAEFEVPDGYMGLLSWKGRLSTAGMVEGVWTDYLSIQISSSLGTKVCLVPGEYDLDSSLYPYFVEPDMADLLCGPGQCSLTFDYVQVGDAAYEADDLVEIFGLGLRLIDHEASSAVIERDEVEFPDVYAGKKAEVEVRILNTGLDPLEVYDVEGEGPFSARFNDYAAQFNQSVSVMLTFTPDEAGDFSGIVEIGTTAGIFEVRCTGKAISTDGMLLIEDFEDDGEGWRVYDRDGDGDGWNLAYNVYGGFPQGHVHSGEECIVSFSWDYLYGTFHPDNWTFSPQFSVPESGAWLTWWSAGDDNNRPGDIYGVYVGEGAPEIGQDFDMDAYECVYTETVISDEWTEHVVDISQFRGKEVHVAFRHFDCSGCYMVKIDDVIVYDHDPASVGAIDSDAEVVSREWYTLDGLRLSEPPARGLVILRETLSDGTIRTLKLNGSRPF